MRRRAFNLATALSLLACVAVMVLWVRSHSVNDQFLFAARGGPMWRVFTHDGGVVVHRVSYWPNPERLRWLSFPEAGGTGGPWLFHERYGGASFARFNCSVAHSTVTILLRRDGTALWKETPEPPQVGTGPEVHSQRLPLVTIGFPFRVAALATGAAPAAWLAVTAAGHWRRRWLRRRLERRGLCRSCGYDLTGNVSGVCPECGRST